MVSRSRGTPCSRTGGALLLFSVGIAMVSHSHKRSFARNCGNHRDAIDSPARRALGSRFCRGKPVGPFALIVSMDDTNPKGWLLFCRHAWRFVGYDAAIARSRAKIRVVQNFRGRRPALPGPSLCWRRPDLWTNAGSGCKLLHRFICHCLFCLFHHKRERQGQARVACHLDIPFVARRTASCASRQPPKI